MSEVDQGGMLMPGSHRGRIVLMMAMLALAGCTSTENPDKAWGLGKNRLVDSVRPPAPAKAEPPPPAAAKTGAVAVETLPNGAPQALTPQAAIPQAAVSPAAGKDSGNLTDRALMLAAKARRGGDTLTASALYRQVLVERPQDFEARLGLAHVLVDTEDFEAARPMCTDLVQSFPQNDRVLALMARLDIAGGDLASASVRLSLGASITPDSRDLLQVQGMFEDMRGNHTAAQRIYSQILATASGDVAVRNNLALSLLADNDPAGAAKILEQLVGEGSVAPAAIRHNLAMAYGLLDRESEARSLLAQDLSDTAIDSNLKFYRWLRLRRLPASVLDSAKPVKELRTPPAVPLNRP